MDLECLGQVCAGSGRPYQEEEREQSPRCLRLGVGGWWRVWEPGRLGGREGTGQCSGTARGGRVTRRHSREAGRRQRQALAAPGGPGPDLDGSWGWGMCGAPSSVARKQRGS